MKYPQMLKITDRTSTITNCFVQAIIPRIEPTEQEYDEALGILGMSRDSITCVYCGGVASAWDHFRPLVRNKKPMGYITEV